MFIPGCGCCGGGGGCVPGCPSCSATCLLLTVSLPEGGGSGGDDGLCSESDLLAERPIILQRGEACDIKITPSVSGNPGGSGAKVAVTLARAYSPDGDYKYINGVTLLESGSGYTNGAKFAYSLTCSGTCNVEPTIKLDTGRAEPILKATVGGGYGAELVPVVAEASVEAGEETWKVGGIAVAASGYKYADGAKVTFSSTGATVVTPAQATISVARSQPSLSAYLYDETRYVSLLISLAEQTSTSGQVWGVSSASVEFQYGTFAEGVSIQPTTPTGVTTVAAAEITVTKVDGSGQILELSATPGAYYATDGSIASVSVTNSGEYYNQDGVKSATLVDGGKFYFANPCTYTGGAGTGDTILCAACPGNAGKGVIATVTLGSQDATLTVSVGGESLFSASTSLDGKACDGLSFESNGLSASVSAIDCQDYDDPDHDRRRKQFCQDMPDQITLSLSGMGPVFTFSSRGGIQTSPGGWCTDGAGGAGASAGMGNVFCGECGPEDGLILRTGGTGSGIFGYTMGLIVQDGSAVLDLVPGPCGSWLYQGALPVPPAVAWTVGYPANVSCNGEPGIPVQVSITPAGLQTTVGISAPTKGTELATATAEVTSVNGTGGITAVTLTATGSGYAREIFTRTEPDMAVTLSASAGTGAVLSATLTQSGTGEGATWAVTSVAVTNGGTGYTGAESVVFTPEAGATAEDAAYGYMVTGRTTPTVTATATGGSGASLSVTLSQTTDWQGLDVWGVSAVSVTSGGTGYTDGSEVTFTVTDGVQYNAGSATITVGREEPSVTASVPAPSAGTGAVLAVTLTASGTSWTVSGLSITNGGSGYSAGDSIALATGDTEESGGYAIVGTVNGSGAITAVTIYSGGSYYRSTGVIESASIGWGGEYYKSTGVITSVVVEYGGTYFISTPTGTVDADTPTIWFSSRTGTGATATAVVDTSLSSSTFGQITSISVGSGGTGYKLSGTGWLCTVSGVGDHLAIKDSNLPVTTAVAGDPIPCTDFESRYTTISERVTTDPCPTSLLSKSYKFSLSFSTDPFAAMPADQEASDGMDFCSRRAGFDSLYGYAHQHTFYDFGNGDIQCTLSPS